MLTLAAAALYGYSGDAHQKLAATVEFIHTATLLHDDVVDESHQRRGRPTANLLWDNKSSVLVGDYLFARAFQLMVEIGSVEVLGVLSNAAATIAEGEVLQLTAAQNLATTEDTYLQVVRGKTAALFEAACEAGGMVAGASQTDVAALKAYGDALGVSFQMADDLLDYGGAAGEMGKNTGRRFSRRQADTTRDPRDRSGRRGRARVLGADDRAWQDRRRRPGAQAQDLMRIHGSLKSAEATAQDWAARAVDALAPLPEHPITDMLRDLARYVVARIS